MSVRAAIPNTRPDGLNNRNLSAPFQRLEEINVSEGLVSPQASLAYRYPPSHHTLPLSFLCAHIPDIFL